MSYSLHQEAVLNRESRVFICCSAVIAALLLLLSLTPASFFLHVSMYAVTLIGKYVCLAILALSLDLIWGYLGILSLGHCAFFALGGYACGMYLSLQGAPGTEGTVLPEFMSFLGWDSLPWFWLPSQSFILTLILIAAVPGLLAFAFGALTFRARVSGVYLSIITQALTYALMLAFFLNELGFGGNNGLTAFRSALGFSITSDASRRVLLLLSVLVLLGVFVLCRLILVSRLGALLTAVRDAESRVRFLGYRPENIKLAVFVFAAVIAGVAGALYVPQAGIINPGEFSPLNSIELVICVALGGRGRLWGAVLGAFIVNFCKTFLTGAFPEIWLFFLGGLFVAVTLFLPQGVAGLCSQFKFFSGLRQARS